MQSTSEEQLQPPSPHPLGADAPTEDHVGLAVRSVGAAIATASAWMGVITWGTLRLQGIDAPTDISQVDPGAAYVNFLLYGLVAAMAVTGTVAYRLMWPVESHWRRGGLSMVAVLGGVSLAMLTTYIARQAGGAEGLLILTAVATLAALWLAHKARQAAQPSDVE